MARLRKKGEARERASKEKEEISSSVIRKERYTEERSNS
jgi:hypothetical protein